MASADTVIQAYRELAENYAEQGQEQMRDRFLVLAADAALSAGRVEEAERLRFRLLQCNPKHLLKPFGSFAEAMQTQDVQNYVTALRRKHPYEGAEHLLENLRPASQQPRSDLLQDRHSRDVPQESAEKVKIYRVQQSDTPVRDLLRAHSTAPDPRQAGRPPKNTDAYPASRERVLPPVVVRRSPDEADDSEPAFWRWVVLALFWLMLCGSLFLTFVTLLRPLLHPRG